MSAIKRNGPPKPGGNPVSQSVEADGWLHVTGCTPKDAEGNFVSGSITVQAGAAMDGLMRRVHDAGYTAGDVVRVGVWLDDPRDFSGFNAVYRRYFAAEHAPARVTVQGTMMNDCKVEVDCIAWKKKG